MLKGHGKCIFCIRVHPIHHHLVLTSSGDLSIRLWNLETMTTTAIFAGLNGHQSGILSLDFHSSGKYFVSAGLDNAIKVWEFTDEIIKHQGTKPIVVHFPLMSSIFIYRNYVDCVQFMGDFIVSKSVRLKSEGNGLDLESGERLGILSLNFKDNKIEIHKILKAPLTKLWFLRFNVHNNLIAYPYQDGTIHIFQYEKEKAIEVLKEKRVHDELVIRETAWSIDGKYLIGGDDHSKLYLWKKEE